MVNFPKGSPIHGDFSSADASALAETAQRFTLYPYGGSTSMTIGSTDYVTVTDLSISSAGTNLTVTIFDGADTVSSSGELIWKGVVPTNTTQPVRLSVPHACQVGTYPKVKASGAGQVDVVMHGTCGTLL